MLVINVFNGKQIIGLNTISPHFHSPKSTHKGKLQTIIWYDFLHLRQEDTSHLCTQYGNTNKGFLIPPDTYLGIFSLPDNTDYLVSCITLPLTHPLCCDDMHLSGAYVCFPTQIRLLCLLKTYLSRTIAHHHTKEDGSKEELSNLQDNLYYQVKKKYQDMCQEG